MFRKVKRSTKKKKGSIRKRIQNDEDESSQDEGEGESLDLETLKQNAKKRKTVSSISTTTTTSSSEKNSTGAASGSVLHQYDSNKTKILSGKEMATREAEHLPTNMMHSSEKVEEKNSNTKKNKLLAGPLKAPSFVRSTCRFDYQPDICKDYKDTGFCGFGDTCIYLHDRTDTLNGWQLEQEWERRKREEKEKKEKELDQFIKDVNNKMNSGGKGDKNNIKDDDGIPFACHLCRGPFKNPVVTVCFHYFCESCIMKHHKEDIHGALCPICKKKIKGVFNYPTKLIAKKRKVLGTGDGSWEDFANALS